MLVWVVIITSLSAMSYIAVRLVQHVKKTGAHISIDMDPTHVPVQQDTRDQATKKRVRKAIEQQQEAMNGRALVAHDPSCKDPLTCKKNPCFIYEPDRTIGDAVRVKNKRAERLKKEKKRDS